MYQSAGDKGLKKNIHEQEGSNKEEEVPMIKDKPHIITITERGTRKHHPNHCKKPVKAFTDNYTNLHQPRRTSLGQGTSGD